MATKAATAKWAQRADTIFLRFEVLESKDVVVDIQEDGLTFTASNKSGDTKYSNTIEFFKKINVEDSGYQIKGRSIDCLIYGLGVLTQFATVLDFLFFFIENFGPKPLPPINKTSKTPPSGPASSKKKRKFSGSPSTSTDGATKTTPKTSSPTSTKTLTSPNS